MDTRTDSPPRLTPYRWMAWYTGGRIFESSLPAEWRTLPREGILRAAIFVHNQAGDVGAHVRSGQTVYWLKRFPDGDWNICTDSRADAHLEGIPQEDIKIGTWATESDMAWADEQSRLAIREAQDGANL